VEIDRCRTIFEKYLQVFPNAVGSWCSYAEFETALSEIDRARSLYLLATQQELD